jgi:hypothetical protein
MTPDLPSPCEKTPSQPPVVEKRTFLGKRVSRGVTVSVLGVVTLVLAVECHFFWSEWQTMRQEMEAETLTAPIGFHNVYTQPSSAVKPENWFRSEGELVYLWAGWERNQHFWFKAGRNDLERRRLSEPISRDVIRSVDDPWVEVGGGSIWEKLPPETLVAGQSLAGVPTAYPMRVLAVMCVVNDLIDDRPFLAVLSNRDLGKHAVGIFDPRVDGKRLSLGTSGYTLDGNLLLYDHETESLWIEERDSVLALSGRQKGNRLPLLARPALIPWSDWKSRNPWSRLLVGTHESPNWTPRSASTTNRVGSRSSL